MFLVLAVLFVGFDSHATTWLDNKVSVVSMVFDDGRVDHRTIAVPELDARGLRGTFALIPGATGWPSSAAFWASAGMSGHELCSHTMLHQICKIQTPEQDAAIPPANTNFHSLEELHNDCVTVKSILDPIQNKPTVSFVYPGGNNEPATREVISQHFLAARLSISGLNVNPATPIDMMQLKPIYIGGAQSTVSDWCDYDQVSAFFANVISACNDAGGWGIEEFHDIDCPGYAAINMPAWYEHLDELSASQSIWVATMGDVVRYIEERNAVGFSISRTIDSAIIVIDDNLDDSIFDVPLTIRTEIPSWLDDVTVLKGGNPIPFTRIGNEIQYNVLPDGEDVSIISNVLLSSCMFGPNVPSSCSFDQDDDNDVDLYDFSLIQRQFP